MTGLAPHRRLQSSTGLSPRVVDDRRCRVALQAGDEMPEGVQQELSAELSAGCLTGAADCRAAGR